MNNLKPDRSDEAAQGRAFRQDALMRAYHEATAMTPTELAAANRAQDAWRFEHGDHQPDGSILPAPPMPKYPGVIGGQGVSLEELLRGKATQGKHYTVATPAHGHNLQAAPWNKPDGPFVGRNPSEIAPVTHNHASSLDERVQYEDLMVTVVIRMHKDTAEGMRKMQAEHPDYMQRLLQALQNEARYGLKQYFGIDAQ